MNAELATEDPTTATGDCPPLEGQPPRAQTLEAADGPADAAPDAPTDLDWQGVVVLRQSPGSLIWLATALAVPAATALIAYAAAGPAAMVIAGVTALLVILTLDHRRPRHSG